MPERLWTTKQVAEYFNLKDTKTVTQKFIKQGLKVILVGSKDYRYDPQDVKDFAETLKQESITVIPIKKKYLHRTIDFDPEKRRINLEMNRVV